MLSLKVKYAVQVLATLKMAPGRMSAGEIRGENGLNAYRLSVVLGALKRAGYIEAINARYFIVRKLEGVSLLDLYQAVDPTHDLIHTDADEGWQPSNREPYAAMISLDKSLSLKICPKLETVKILDLFPSYESLVAARDQTQTSKR